MDLERQARDPDGADDVPDGRRSGSASSASSSRASSTQSSPAASPLPDSDRPTSKSIRRHPSLNEDALTNEAPNSFNLKRENIARVSACPNVVHDKLESKPNSSNKLLKEDVGILIHEPGVDIHNGNLVNTKPKDEQRMKPEESRAISADKSDFQASGELQVSYCCYCQFLFCVI